MKEKIRGLPNNKNLNSRLEQRIFLTLLMIGMLLTFLSGAANLYYRTPVDRVLAPFAMTAIIGGFFWYAVSYGRFRGPILAASLFACVGLVPYLWMAHGGLFGGFPFFVPYLTVVLMAIHQGGRRWIYLLVLFATTGWMIYLDLLGSELIKPITDPRVLLYSNLYGLIGSALSVTVLFLIFSRSYEEEQQRVLKMAAALREANRELEYLSRFDTLTSLPNRRDITEKMEYQLRLSNRNQQPFGLLMVDVDHFKKFNDHFGHQCGDYVLKALAELMLSLKREQDSVARWGGEEFILLLPDTDLRGTMVMAERLRSAVENHSFNDGVNRHQLTITVGATVFDLLSEQIDHTIRKADTALYWGKEQGRNRCYAYTTRMIEMKELL
ncbi:GGDEF domain-containing protein [Anoxynatronum sibiricum]|uniref:GGDEF domain-containing protein n=1 Tax=Anoxynatronum sibiricum TaxID=210623 RepID=A0ABU9VQX7_9CLOT